MRKVDMLQRAYMDIQAAKAISAYEFTDGLQYDALAYHVQQSVEKLMKYELESHGIEYPFEHRVNILFELMESNNLNPPEWIWQNRVILNDYATRTRYGEDLVATKSEAVELLELSISFYNDIQQKQLKQQEDAREIEEALDI